MKKAVLCYRNQHNNSYVGGVVSIMNSYLSHKSVFSEYGIDLDKFCYEPDERWEKVSGRISNVAYIFQQRRALLQRLKKFDADIVNIHTSREFLFLKDVLLAKMVKKQRHIPAVLTIHVGDIDTVFNRIGPLKKYLLNIMNRYVDKTVFLTEKIRNQFIEAGIKRDRTEVLYNFHDLPQNNTVIRKNNNLHLIYVGAIHREKGILELLHALKKLKEIDYHIDICGQLTDQTIKDEFDHVIEELGQKAELHGYVSGKFKTQLLERADILILPSYHEGMPLVILEALASGCAIISTPVGGTTEILKDENVKWVAVRSTEDIEEAIRQFAVSPDLLKTMQCTNTMLSKSFSINKNIELLCSIYNEL